MFAGKASGTVVHVPHTCRYNQAHFLNDIADITVHKADLARVCLSSSSRSSRCRSLVDTLNVYGAKQSSSNSSS